MLYTIIPMDAIYRDSNIKDKKRTKGEENETNYKEINLKYGRVIAKQQGDKYIVEHMESTDMSDYLNDDYKPGAVIDASIKYDNFC